MSDQPYNIFPWSPVINPAKSSPLWLICHTMIALFSSYVNYRWYFQQRQKMRTKTDRFELLALFCHMAFSLLVIMNIFNLGNVDPDTAFIINFTALFGLTISHMAKSPLMYFLILNFPVYLEVVRLISYYSQLG